MVDFTKPVQTRGGRKARVLATDIKNKDWPIAAVVAGTDGTESVVSYRADGNLIGGVLEYLDLVNVPETRTIYLNVYKNGQGQLIAFEGETPYSADGRRPGGCVGRAKVVLEEGRFDD